MSHAMPPRQPEPTQWQQYAHQQPPQWATAPPPPSPPKKRKRWPWIVLAAAVLLLFVIVGAATSGDSDPGPAAPPVQVTTPAAAAPEQPAPSGPVTSFGAGTYEVGAGDGQVAPGKYKTAGPSDGLPSCYWARLKNTDGDSDSIITNGNAEGPTVVTIGNNDGAFETRCTWTKAG